MSSIAKDVIARVDAAVLELNKALRAAHEENIRFGLSVQSEYSAVEGDKVRNWGATMVVVEQAYQVFRDRQHRPVVTAAEHAAAVAKLEAEKKLLDQLRFEQMESV